MKNPQITKLSDGRVEDWFDENNRIFFHRIGLPAVIYYDENNNKTREYYYLFGKIHREDGPAAIYYNKSDIIYQGYFFNDIEYDTFEKMQAYIKTQILN